MKPANTKARALLAKLEAMAERGINGERDAAKAKLDRLKARFDFSASDPNGPDLFKGSFQRSTNAQTVLADSTIAGDVLNAVKWALENETKISCLFRNGALLAEATPKTAATLATIAKTVAHSFTQLWEQFQATPGTNPADRGSFMLGLYEGMLNETRTNEALPKRLRIEHTRKAKRRALNHAPGLSIHPYTIAVNLGKQIRFCVPLDTMTQELDRSLKGEIAA